MKVTFLALDKPLTWRDGLTRTERHILADTLM